LGLADFELADLHSKRSSDRVGGDVMPDGNVTPRLDRESAWEELFKKFRILEHVDESGCFDISAHSINNIGGPDARLMAKIAENKVAMLAIKNGEYRIGKFDPFFSISESYDGRVDTVCFPKDIITLDPTCINTESAALDIATVTGMLDSVFGEKVNLTIRGRTRAGANFDFRLGSVSFPVTGVQVEVDGGYEGPTSVSLVEAKIGGKSNLAIRQFLYAQRCWEKLVSKYKAVRSYLFLYQEPYFRFIPVICSGDVVVADGQNERTFRIAEEGKFDLARIRVEGDESQVDLSVPFPQADDFGRVLAMLSVIAGQGRVRKPDLALEFDITGRQIDYYFAVLRWLKLCSEHEDEIELTHRGREISQMSHIDRMFALATIIFSEPVFYQALHTGSLDSASPAWCRWQLSDSTKHRRGQTVAKWVNYFRSIEANTYHS
jgi:hypothetical protein